MKSFRQFFSQLLCKWLINDWTIDKNKNMKFSIETVINRSLSFLDKKIFWENDKFVTSAFRKGTFSAVYINFLSFIPLEYKFGLVHTLLNHCFNYLQTFWNSIMRLINLRKFSRKMHIHKFIDKCSQKFLNNMFIQWLQIPTVLTKET